MAENTVNTFTYNTKVYRNHSEWETIVDVGEWQVIDAVFVWNMIAWWIDIGFV